ncbi:MAG: type II toxin-antitoxin system VapB family antitoxin [Chloroflexi bacterium]|nr:type II toxin-antitoxin system VapB family antitoxin [Chloroflexota bacterium]
MRTNIVLDKDLLERAKALTGIKTTRAVVDEALRTLIRLREQARVREYRGRFQWEGELDAARIARIIDKEDDHS